MYQFDQVCILDKTILSEEAIARIQTHSRQPVRRFDDRPSPADIAQRIDGADCVLLSRHTVLDAPTLLAAKELRYVGICASKYTGVSATVHEAAAAERLITVTGVSDYSDPAVLEWLTAQLVTIYREERAKGLPAEELYGKHLGIVGMGHMGRKVAPWFQRVGLSTHYYNRSRKEDMEAAGTNYQDLPALLHQSDIVTIHVPRNSLRIDAATINQLKKDTILIHTSLGVPFDEQALYNWLKAHPAATFVMDSDGSAGLQLDFQTLPNVRQAHYSCGYTRQTIQRLADSVISQLEQFLQVNARPW